MSCFSFPLSCLVAEKIEEEKKEKRKKKLTNSVSAF